MNHQYQVFEQTGSTIFQVQVVRHPLIPADDGIFCIKNRKYKMV